jgi:hypothetical protein
MPFDSEATLLRENPSLFPADFEPWFGPNHHVWKAFCDEAFHIRAKGFKRYSARTVIEVLRHHSAATEAPGAVWKINNNHAPYMARLFDLRYPSCAGMWQYREAVAQ